MQRREFIIIRSGLLLLLSKEQDIKALLHKLLKDGEIIYCRLH